MPDMSIIDALKTSLLTTKQYVDNNEFSKNYNDLSNRPIIFEELERHTMTAQEWNDYLDTTPYSPAAGAESQSVSAKASFRTSKEIPFNLSNYSSNDEIGYCFEFEGQFYLMNYEGPNETYPEGRIESDTTYFHLVRIIPNKDGDATKSTMVVAINNNYQYITSDISFVVCKLKKVEDAMIPSCIARKADVDERISLLNDSIDAVEDVLESIPNIYATIEYVDAATPEVVTEEDINSIITEIDNEE